jgi:hypothetical protein
MNDSYQLGPVSISKSFVKQPLFWPMILGSCLVVAGLVGLTTGQWTPSSRAPKPTMTTQVFPLTQRLSKKVLFSAGTTIYGTDGQTEEKLFEVGSEVLSLVPSNDGARLAATYKTPSGGVNAAGYPFSTLIIYDMVTKRSLPIIAQNRTTVRYPLWSDDSRYLSFWINEGEESFVYDTTRRKAIFSVKKTGSVAVSPIVFLPGTSGIVYVKDNTLFSAAVDGSRPIALAEQVASTRTVPGLAPVAAAPILSPNGSYLAYYKLNGELAVVQTTTRESKTVGSNVTSLGFLNDTELLYIQDVSEAKKNRSIERFSILDGKSMKLSGLQSNTIVRSIPKALVFRPTQSELYLASLFTNVGPQKLDKDGHTTKDCSIAEFQFGYNNSHDDTRFPQSHQVISPDGAHLLGTSDNSLAVMDTTTCQPYLISGTKPVVSTWLP